MGLLNERTYGVFAERQACPLPECVGSASISPRVYSQERAFRYGVCARRGSAPGKRLISFHARLGAVSEPITNTEGFAPTSHRDSVPEFLLALAL
jgi:hypothetical protein